ncbi:MAG TPA: hypothetical protein VIK55_07815 [Paludibacter sp.]
MRLKIKQAISRNLLNLPGWRSKRKIIVIESDDWGSIRMASKDAFEYFKSKGYPVAQNAYNSYDALESEEDLEKLFEVLSFVKDKNGNPAKLTANSVVANPDFDRIAQSDYQQYFYEPFTETYKRYPNHNNSFQILKQGIDSGVVMPQFHSREHLNVKRWMRSLQQWNQASLEAFGQNMYSVSQPFEPGNRNEYMDALDFDSQADSDYIEEVLKEGLILFRQIWGFKSTSFIANCYVWHSSIEKLLADEGVKYIQGMVIQSEPLAEPGTYNYKKRYHYQGQKNRYGQVYLIRNAFFEPSQNRHIDWVNDCLNRIETAFRWHKPAIISSHRVNFMGFLDPSNRDRNLILFKQLLSEIVKRWPSVEFMSSDELGAQISKKQL